MQSSKKRLQQSATNPFEAKWTILSGVSRKKAQASSLQNRRNVFVDRRIAEGDPSLPEEDRYLARLQRERTRQTKKRALFSLHDNDPANEAMPGTANEKHSPQSQPRDDYEDSEADDPTVPEGGNEENGGDELLTLKKEESEDGDARHRKTHREVMGEVMLKSKMHKAKRQYDKTATDEQTAKLDEELPEIMTLLAKSGNELVNRDTDDTRESGKPDLSIFNENVDASSVEELDMVMRKPYPTSGKSGSEFHYEKVYQQLAAEKRAKPSERLLTEEERAEKEMSELKRLEVLRTERMNNAEELEDVELHFMRQKKRAEKGPRKREEEACGDDLDNGFDLDSPSDSSAAEDEVKQVSENESMKSSLFPPGDSANLRPSKQKFTEGITPDSLIFHAGRKSISRSDSDIPFIFKECPSTDAELQSVFEGRSVEQRNLILGRIRKCFAVSLDPSVNQTKLEKLLDCLLRRVETLINVSVDFIGAAVAEVDVLLVHIYELGKFKDTMVMTWAKEKLAEMYDKLTSDEGAEYGLSKNWTVGSVILLRAVGRLFPSSDLRHPVSTPLVLLLSEAVELKRMFTLRDVGLGILVGSALLEQMVESERYCGQLVRFLIEVIRAGHCKERRRLGEVLREFRQARQWSNDVMMRRLKVSNVMKSEWTDQDKSRIQIGIVGSAVRMIEALTFGGNVGHMDIVLRDLPLDEIRDREAAERISAIMVQAKANRKTMTLYTRTGPSSISKMLNPKFSSESGVFRRKAKTSYHALQNGDVSASASRVRQALRKEERGLARDVRQAAMAQNREKYREETERRERREKRSREVMAFLEEQQATWKRAHKRQKKLSGKKW